MADREKVIKAYEVCTDVNGNCYECPYTENGEDPEQCNRQALKDALSLLKAQEPCWTPFIKRPLTKKEKKMHPEWCYILEGKVPEDEQEILLYRHWKNAEGYIIEMDRYCNNGDECYLEGAGDIENGMWWCALPEPPKEV